MTMSIETEQPNEENWQDYAACQGTDPEAFYPEKGGSTREAKKICDSCEVRGLCLQYALEHNEPHGVWGGMTERERAKFKRTMGRTATYYAAINQR